MGLKISEIEFAVPKDTSNLDSLENEFFPWKADEIFKKTGVNTRHVANKEETSLDLALKACNLIFKNQKKTILTALYSALKAPTL